MPPPDHSEKTSQSAKSTQTQSSLIIQNEINIHEKNLANKLSSASASVLDNSSSSSSSRLVRRETQESAAFLLHSEPLSLNQGQEGQYQWPLPLDDKSAIQRNELLNLPSTREAIKSSLHEPNCDLMVRIVTWNQQAKSLPSIEELRRYVFMNINDDDEGGGGEESCTYNLGADVGEDAGIGSDQRNFNQRFHIIAIGTQECENSFTKSILNPLKTNWERCCSNALGDEYMLIQSHALLASHLAIFAHKAILHLITNIRSHAVPTGICNTMGNKGGIGIALNVSDVSFCFLTAHLAAHQDQIDRRTAEFASISNEVANKLGWKSDSLDDGDIDGIAMGTKKGGKTKVDKYEEITRSATTSTATTSIRTLGNESIGDECRPLTDNSTSGSTNSDGGKDSKDCSPCSKSFCRPCQCSRCCGELHDYTENVNPLLREFDYVFWGGDLNYRINATREVVNSLLKENRHDVLIANDQLSLLLQFEKTFAGFVEGKVTFRPTYKYDKGKDVYDTSIKRRTPSWTDRILYKKDSEVDMISYFCAQEVRTSDHRPVYASFRCKIGEEVDEEPLMGSEVLRCESRSEVCVIS